MPAPAGAAAQGQLGCGSRPAAVPGAGAGTRRLARCGPAARLQWRRGVRRWRLRAGRAGLVLVVALQRRPARSASGRQQPGRLRRAVPTRQSAPGLFRRQPDAARRRTSRCLRVGAVRSPLPGALQPQRRHPRSRSAGGQAAGLTVGNTRQRSLRPSHSGSGQATARASGCWVHRRLRLSTGKRSRSRSKLRNSRRASRARSLNGTACQAPC